MGHEVTGLNTMTAAQQVLASFDQLSDEEQLVVAKEVQRRAEAITDPFADLDFSPIEAEERTYMARKLFAMYDEEEARKDGQA
jgi:hypothetical protein